MPRLSTYCGALFAQSNDADVVLVIGSASQQKEIFAHSLLLRRSGYFKAALSPGFEESLTHRIVIDDIQPALFEILVAALYTDELPQSPCLRPEELLDMLSLCRRFLFPDTISLAVLSALASQVQWGKNTLLITAKAYELGLTKAIDVCLNMVTHNLRHAQAEFGSMAAAFPPVGTVGVGAIPLARARMALAQRLSALIYNARLPRMNLEATVCSIQREVRDDRGIRRVWVPVEMCDPADVEKKYREVEQNYAYLNDLRDLLFDEMHTSMQALLSDGVDFKAVAEKRQRDVFLRLPRLCSAPIWGLVRRWCEGREAREEAQQRFWKTLVAERV